MLQYEPDDPFDPRELSEMPDIRLWFVRLDETYPWLPIVLDWRAGELARYAAMLVPHQVLYQPDAMGLLVSYLSVFEVVMEKSIGGDPGRSPCGIPHSNLVGKVLYFPLFLEWLDEKRCGSLER